ncbi:MAG: uridine kinase [Christensenellales bacterium]|jgi:uridine kinase
MDHIMLIGIAGGTGSGKTTLSRAIQAHFPGNVSIVYHDNYYKAHDNMTYAQRAELNFDHPDAFDTPLMLEHLRQLKAGQPVRCPVYDFTAHNRSDKTVHIEPRPVILLEGILILQDTELCDLMDLKLFVDTDADVRILRRIRRDVRERGRSLDSVISQYLTTVKPMHEQFVEPSKRRADIIIPEGGRNPVALDMIFHHIINHMEK